MKRIPNNHPYLTALNALNPDGINAYLVAKRLEQIENTLHRHAEELCSYPMTDRQMASRDNYAERVRREILEYFPVLANGLLYINRDPRGFSLKIDNDTPQGRELIAASGLHTDWGGYGLLCPAANID